MPIEEPFKETKKKLKEFEKKYNVSEIIGYIYEIENIRKAEETNLLNELKIEDESFVYVKDEAKKDAKLIGISSKEGEEETGEKTMYSTVKDFGRSVGNLKHELSCTGACWLLYAPQKESKNYKGRKNNE